MSDEQEHDVEALLRKNAELLGEVKALKAKVAELEGERDSANDDSSQAQAAMQKLLLDDPLERTFGEAFSLPWRYMRPVIEEHFTFALGDGKPLATPVAGGDPIDLEAAFQAVFTIPDLAAALRPARGGGAKGSHGLPRIEPEKQDAPRKVASQFGLR
jgi:cell division septum initiation protein DivIVA